MIPLQEWGYLVLLVAKADGLEGKDFLQASREWDLHKAWEQGMTPVEAYTAMMEDLS